MEELSRLPYMFTSGSATTVAGGATGAEGQESSRVDWSIVPVGVVTVMKEDCCGSEEHSMR